MSAEILQTIASAISQLGYPVVMTLLLAWYVKYTGDKSSETIATMQQQILSLSETQNNQLDKLTQSMHEIQQSLTMLSEIVRRGGDDVK